MSLGQLIGLSNGSGVGFSFLWLWLILDFLTKSWDIVSQPENIRKEAWKWGRAGTLLLGLDMMFIYNIENILRAEKLITEYQSFSILLLANILHSVALILLLTWFDRAKGNSQPTYLLYSVIAGLFTLGGLLLT